MPAKSPLDFLITRHDRLNFPSGRQDGGWYTIANHFNLLPAATQGGAADMDFDLTLGAGTDNPSACTFLAPSTVFPGRGLGGVNCVTSATTTADEAALWPLATSRFGKGFVITANQELLFDAVVRVGSSIASTAIVCGLKFTDTAVAGTDDDQAIFVFDTANTTLNPTNLTASANWVTINSVAGTDVATSTGVAVAASTDYRLTITVDGNRVPRYYVNGGLKVTGAALTATASLIPTFRSVTRTTAAKTHGVRYIRVGEYA